MNAAPAVGPAARIEEGAINSNGVQLRDTDPKTPGSPAATTGSHNPLSPPAGTVPQDSSTPGLKSQEKGDPPGAELASTKAINQSPTPKPDEWISTALQAWSVLLFIAWDLSLVVAIAVLWVLSKRNNGFVSVSHDLTASNGRWGWSLLWTTLPSLVFTCLRLHWGAIYSAASDRQPFVELARLNGSPARRSVMLDYRASMPPVRLFKCFQNRHWSLALAELAVWSFNIIPPLSAGLLVASTATLQQSIPIVATGSFDHSLMNSTMDTRAILDSVTAILIHGAGHIPWTDDEYAFAPFLSVFDVEDGSLPANATTLTANTTAHSAYLNCAELTPGADFNMNVSQSPTTDGVAGKVIMSGTDRGCAINQEFDVDERQEVYFTTTTEITCGIQASYSRLIFTYGHFSRTSPTLLSNLSVISCAAGYRVTTGDLVLTVSSSSSSFSSSSNNTTPEILSFTPNSPLLDSRGLAFGFWRQFEQKLFTSLSFSAGTEWATTDFGTVALYRALQLQHGNQARSTDASIVLRGESLVRAVADVFTSVYSIGMATAGLIPEDENSGQREQREGVLEMEITRLYVVPAVAATLMAMLVVLCSVAGLVGWYSWSHETLLYEEPAGLLAHAALLSSSELLTVVKEVKDANGFSGKVGNANLTPKKKSWRIRRKSTKASGSGAHSVVDDRRWIMHPRDAKPKIERVRAELGPR
jgi:hypothetical protein